MDKSTNSNENDNQRRDTYGPSLPPSGTSKESFGPALPPHLLNKNTTTSSNEAHGKEIIGPQLPPHLLNKSSENSESSENQSIIGPALPPHLLKKTSKAISESNSIGPELPPHLRQKLRVESGSNKDNDSDEEDVYGPLPVGETSKSKSYLALEERAMQYKIDQLDSDDNKVVKREEWMLELPTATASNLGLGARQFRSKAGPDMSDRSVWTETAADKAKKKSHKSKKEVDLKKEEELKQIRKRDGEQELIAEKYGNKHKRSLVDMHQEKLKKQKSDKDSTERVPFNRETDLQVNRFDEAQKKAVLKKAQLLDDRFSSGRSKFL